MTVYKGNILSVNSNNDVFRYLVEDGGKIVFVGDVLPDQYCKANIIDLENKSLVPAFVDTHQHFASFSTFNAGLNVMDATSNAEIIRRVREFSENRKDKLLIAFGASPYSVNEKRLVNRSELDSACPNKMIMMVKYDGHACVVNTPLLKKIEKKIKNLRGYHPDTGEMNQEAFFAVSDYVTASIKVPVLVKNMQQAVDDLAAKGIGMVHTVSGVGFPLNLDISLEKWFAKSLSDGFQIRVFPQSLNTKVATKRHIPRIGGCFECALDGCFGSKDAALNEAYQDNEDNYKGILYYSDQKVIDFCKRANRLGLQIELHAIGDKAFDQATRAIKAALDDYPRKDHRHGIIHACLPTEEGLKICEEYGIQLPMQIAFDNWRQEPPEYTESILGKERNKKLNPIRTFLNKNCSVSFGSDAPCTYPDPIEWIYKAVNHSNPNESVDIKQALRMATFNGCYASFDEKKRGSLEVGKYADMVILSSNPYEISKEDLKELKVEKLFLKGVAYKKQSKSVIMTILKGMFSCNKSF